MSETGQPIVSMKAVNVLTAGGWRAAWAWAVILVLALRMGLGAIMGAAWMVVRPSLPVELLTDLSKYDYLPIPTTFPGDAMLSVWVRWDAVHYLNLARVGYFGASEGDSVYYPLYPVAVRFVTWTTGGNYAAGGLLISTLAAVVMFACLYRITEGRYGADSARWTVVALAVYPTAFFLIAPFTEVLFLALTLGAFLAAHARRWQLAGVLGALASLTRGPGILTVAALAWIAWEQWCGDGRPLWLSWAGIRRAMPVAIGLAMPLLGGLAFGWWRRVAGFPPMSGVLNQYSPGVAFTDPVSGLWLAIAQWITIHDLPTTLEVSSTLAFLGLSGAMLANRRWRRVDWLIYMGVNLSVLLSKHAVQASYLQSLARYVLALFPAFIVIGDWLAHRGPQVRFAYLTLSGALLIVLSALYALWWFIG